MGQGVRVRWRTVGRRADRGAQRKSASAGIAHLGADPGPRPAHLEPRAAPGVEPLHPQGVVPRAQGHLARAPVHAVQPVVLHDQLAVDEQAAAVVGGASRR